MIPVPARRSGPELLEMPEEQEDDAELIYWHLFWRMTLVAAA